MKRLFVGLALPENIKNQILSIQGNMDEAVWRNPERLHLNLRFIGNVTEDIMGDIQQELSYIRFPVFQLALKEVGYFSIGNNPHHLWLGVDNKTVLEELHTKINAAVLKAYPENNDRFKFLPHVAIAKLHGANMNSTFQYITKNNLFHSTTFSVESFTLFSSEAREDGEGKYYIPESEYALTQA